MIFNILDNKFNADIKTVLPKLCALWAKRYKTKQGGNGKCCHSATIERMLEEKQTSEETLCVINGRRNKYKDKYSGLATVPFEEHAGMTGNDSS